MIGRWIFREPPPALAMNHSRVQADRELDFEPDPLPFDLRGLHPHPVSVRDVLLSIGLRMDLDQRVGHPVPKGLDFVKSLFIDFPLSLRGPGMRA
jgi:hypothetical protein